MKKKSTAKLVVRRKTLRAMSNMDLAHAVGGSEVMLVDSDADLVVEALDKAERDLVLRFAVGGNPVPMAVNHLGELLVRLEALPLERVAAA